MVLSKERGISISVLLTDADETQIESQAAKSVSTFQLLSPEVIRMAVMLYIRYPLSLRNVKDLLFGYGIVVCQETVRFWWIRFGPMFAAEIRRRRVDHMHGRRH